MHWVRVVYLYLFALVGLVLVTIGGVQLVSLGLRTLVFTQADAEQRMFYAPDPPLRYDPSRVDRLATDTTVELTEHERDALRQWAQDYQRLREQRAGIDPVVARRQREAARALAFLLVGLPLFGYHWRVIHREREAGRAG